MRKTTKLIAGAAVVMVAAGAGMPALTGYMLENALQERITTGAEKFEFSIASVEVDRSFSNTNIKVLLEGDGLRQLSQESLEIGGTISHNHIFSLPEIMTANLDFTYYQYKQGIKIGLPGTVAGKISWNGAIEAGINTESIEVPLDPMGVSTLLLEPVSGVLKVGSEADQNVALELNQLTWTITDSGKALMSASVDPSQITVSPSAETWDIDVPSISLSLSEDKEKADLTLEAISIKGQQASESEMLSSSVNISTGQLTIPVLEQIKADKVIEGFTLSSSVENINESAIVQLSVLMKEARLMNNEKAVEKAAKEFLVELSEGNPRVALDDFTLKTAKGDLGVSFDIASTDESREILNTIIESQSLTLEQEDELAYQFMMGMNSSAKITLSDDLVDWSCERVGEQIAVEQGVTSAEGEFIANMCKTMADSGEFLSVPCMEVADPQQQAQCMETMSQVKVVWAESKTLEVVLNDGKLMLNGASLELPTTM